jgi:hypothetical protein
MWHPSCRLFPWQLFSPSLVVFKSRSVKVISCAPSTKAGGGTTKLLRSIAFAMPIVFFGLAFTRHPQRLAESGLGFRDELGQQIRTRSPPEARIHFLHDSYSITAEGKNVLNLLIKRKVFNKIGIKVIIVGHTDTTGTKAYNLNLSYLRAKAVKAFLNSNDMPKNTKIFIFWKGEEDLPFQTPDETSSFFNRVTEIMIK